MIVRRVGLVLAVLISLAALLPALDIRPDPATGTVGPLAIAVAVVTALLALVTLAFLVPAWRGDRASGLVIGLAQLCGILTSLPAFFAPAELVPAGGVLFASLGALLAIVVFAMVAVDASNMLLFSVALVVTVALYAALVAAGTALMPPGADRFVQTTAAVLVAAVFPAVLLVLRRTVGRAIYGGRLDPADTALRVGRHAGGADAVATTVAEAARALRLPGLELREGDAVVASAATRTRAGATTVALPLGTADLSLRVTLRAGEGALHSGDRAALALLAVPLALLVRESRLLDEVRAARAAVADVHERAQLALHRDLHDGLGPLLTAAVMRADAARNLVARDPAAAAGELDAARTDLRAAIAEVRHVVYGLWPLELEQRGLWAAIAARAARSGAVVELPGHRPGLSPAVELAAYRIASEALTNADRHAPGLTPTIAVRTDDDALTLTVSNPAPEGPAPEGPAPEGLAQHGVGVASMRARAEELGGTLRVGVHAGLWHVEAGLPLSAPAGGQDHRVRHDEPGGTESRTRLTEPHP